MGIWNYEIQPEVINQKLSLLVLKKFYVWYIPGIQ
jgi:hypothetical protein